MKFQDVLIGALIGGIVYHFWQQSRKKKTIEGTMTNTMVALKEVANEQSTKFSEALKKEYDIVMPSDMVSKKVRKKSNQLNKGRNSISVQDVKAPVTI